MTETGEKISLTGFSPSTSEAQVIRKTIEAVEQVAPSDAAVRFALGSSNGQLEGKLVVNSSAAHFEVQDRSASLEDLLGSLRTALFGQIDQWKRERFSIDAG